MRYAYMIAGMGLTLFVPSMAGAGTDCRMIDLADHVELVCVGDEKFTHLPEKAAKASEPAPVQTDPDGSGKPNAPDKDLHAASHASNSAAVQSFQKYIPKERERSADVASKRMIRLNAIREEMRRHPPVTAQVKPVDPE